MRKIFVVLLLILALNVWILVRQETIKVEPVQVDRHIIDSVKVENRIIDSMIFDVQKKYINDTAYIRVADYDTLYKLFSEYIESYQRTIADSGSNIR